MDIKNTVSSLLSKYKLDEGRSVSWIDKDSICLKCTSGFYGDFTETLKFSKEGNINITLNNVTRGGNTSLAYNVDFLSILSKIYKTRGSFR